jgi:hypothetical protein
MATLTALSASHGFTAGDLDTSGYVAMIPAFQKVYFADGRTYSATIGDSGYHKLDFINTRIVGTVTGTFTQGEVVTQADNDAKGIFDETVGSGATAKTLIYRTNTTEFIAAKAITGADSGATVTPAASGNIIAPPHWLNWILTDGDFPDGGSNIGCLCFGRIFLNSMLNPHQWYCSRVFDPLDFDTSQTDVAAATYSQNSKAGEVGDPIVAMMPYKDIYLIWGCANQIWTLTSDPLMGGVNRCLSKSTGIFSPTSYCWDDKNNLYFLGTDGIYGLSAEAIANSSPPENLTKQRNPKLISSLGLNRRTDRVAMGFDKKRYGIKVSVAQQDGQWAVPWWFDLRTTGGLFPEKYASGQEAASLFYYDSYKSSERGLLIGGYDGYIRKEDEDEKSDDGSNAIESHFSIGPITADGEPRGEVGINEASIVAGEDTDGVTVEYYRADSADEVVSNVLDENTALISNTLTGDGLNNSIINRVSGRAVVVKVKNETADESFSIEQINLSLQSEGRKDK